MAAGMASFGCFFPSFDLSTKNAVNMDSPDVGVEAAFSDVKEAFQVASDCLQNGIDNVSK